jgi:hypothetical protein
MDGRVDARAPARLGTCHETVECRSCPIRRSRAAAACTAIGPPRGAARRCRPALRSHDLSLDGDIELSQDIRRHLFDRDNRVWSRRVGWQGRALAS